MVCGVRGEPRGNFQGQKYLECLDWMKCLMIRGWLSKSPKTWQLSAFRFALIDDLVASDENDVSEFDSRQSFADDWD